MNLLEASEQGNLKGMTALMLANKQGHAEIVELLKQNNAKA